MTEPGLTAAQAGLVSCEACHLLSRPAGPHELGYCRRCGEKLEHRRHHSIENTWALVIAAAICYIPANLLPVFTTTTLGEEEPDTILSGVIYFWVSGAYGLAAIVFIASFLVPLFKLAVLFLLVVTAQRGSSWRQHERAKLYHIIEIIGRWSMLDVFVAAFTVALVQLQPLTSVAPGAGVLFFAAVVVLTMLAAEAFDPRLIWDAGNPSALARHG